MVRTRRRHHRSVRNRHDRIDAARHDSARGARSALRSGFQRAMSLPCIDPSFGTLGGVKRVRRRYLLLASPLCVQARASIAVAPGRGAGRPMRSRHRTLLCDAASRAAKDRPSCARSSTARCVLAGSGRRGEPVAAPPRSGCEKSSVPRTRAAGQATRYCHRRRASLADARRAKKLG